MQTAGGTQRLPCPHLAHLGCVSVPCPVPSSPHWLCGREPMSGNLLCSSKSRRPAPAGTTSFLTGITTFLPSSKWQDLLIAARFGGSLGFYCLNGLLVGHVPPAPPAASGPRPFLSHLSGSLTYPTESRFKAEPDAPTCPDFAFCVFIAGQVFHGCCFLLPSCGCDSPGKKGPVPLRLEGSR